MRLLLVLLALTAVGCVSISAPATAPPTAVADATIAMVTPRPTAEPTARPTPRPTPQVFDDGTPWMTYLGWGIQANEEMLDVWHLGEDGNFFEAAEAGGPVVREQLAWLRSHPPMDCYAIVHEAQVDVLEKSQAAFDAIDRFALDEAQVILQEALDAQEYSNLVFDLVTC